MDAAPLTCMHCSPTDRPASAVYDGVCTHCHVRMEVKAAKLRQRRREKMPARYRTVERRLAEERVEKFLAEVADAHAVSR